MARNFSATGFLQYMLRAYGRGERRGELSLGILQAHLVLFLLRASTAELMTAKYMEEVKARVIHV